MSHGSVSNIADMSNHSATAIENRHFIEQFPEEKLDDEEVSDINDFSDLIRLEPMTKPMSNTVADESTSQTTVLNGYLNQIQEPVVTTAVKKKSRSRPKKSSSTPAVTKNSDVEVKSIMLDVMQEVIDVPKPTELAAVLPPTRNKAPRRKKSIDEVVYPDKTPPKDVRFVIKKVENVKRPSNKLVNRVLTVEAGLESDSVVTTTDSPSAKSSDVAVTANSLGSAFTNEMLDEDEDIMSLLFTSACKGSTADPLAGTQSTTVNDIVDFNAKEDYSTLFGAAVDVSKNSVMNDSVVLSAKKAKKRKMTSSIMLDPEKEEIVTSFEPIVSSKKEKDAVELGKNLSIPDHFCMSDDSKKGDSISKNVTKDVTEQTEHLTPVKNANEPKDLFNVFNELFPANTAVHKAVRLIDTQSVVVENKSKRSRVPTGRRKTGKSLEPARETSIVSSTPNDKTHRNSEHKAPEDIESKDKPTDPGSNSLLPKMQLDLDLPLQSFVTSGMLGPTNFYSQTVSDVKDTPVKSRNIVEDVVGNISPIVPTESVEKQNKLNSIDERKRDGAKTTVSAECKLKYAPVVDLVIMESTKEATKKLNKENRDKKTAAKLSGVKDKVKESVETVRRESRPEETAENINMESKVSETVEISNIEFKSIQSLEVFESPSKTKDTISRRSKPKVEDCVEKLKTKGIVKTSSQEVVNIFANKTVTKSSFVNEKVKSPDVFEDPPDVIRDPSPPAQRGFALSNFLPVRSTILNSLSNSHFGERPKFETSSKSSKSGKPQTEERNSSPVFLQEKEMDLSVSNSQLWKSDEDQVNKRVVAHEDGVLQASICDTVSDVANIECSTQTMPKKPKKGKRSKSKKKTGEEKNPVDLEVPTASNVVVPAASNVGVSNDSFTVTFTENDLMSMVDHVENMEEVAPSGEAVSHTEDLTTMMQTDCDLTSVTHIVETASEEPLIVNPDIVIDKPAVVNVETVLEPDAAEPISNVDVSIGESVENISIETQTESKKKSHHSRKHKRLSNDLQGGGSSSAKKRCSSGTEGKDFFEESKDLFHTPHRHRHHERKKEKRSHRTGDQTIVGEVDEFNLNTPRYVSGSPPKLGNSSAECDLNKSTLSWLDTYDVEVKKPAVTIEYELEIPNIHTSIASPSNKASEKVSDYSFSDMTAIFQISKPSQKAKDGRECNNLLELSDSFAIPCEPVFDLMSEFAVDRNISLLDKEKDGLGGSFLDKEINKIGGFSQDETYRVKNDAERVEDVRNKSPPPPATPAPAARHCNIATLASNVRSVVVASKLTSASKLSAQAARARKDGMDSTDTSVASVSCDYTPAKTLHRDDSENMDGRSEWNASRINDDDLVTGSPFKTSSDIRKLRNDEAKSRVELADSARNVSDKQSRSLYSSSNEKFSNETSSLLTIQSDNKMSSSMSHSVSTSYPTDIINAPYVSELPERVEDKSTRQREDNVYNVSGRSSSTTLTAATHEASPRPLSRVSVVPENPFVTPMPPQINSFVTRVQDQSSAAIIEGGLHGDRRMSSLPGNSSTTVSEKEKTRTTSNGGSGGSNTATNRSSTNSSVQVNSSSGLSNSSVQRSSSSSKSTSHGGASGSSHSASSRRADSNSLLAANASAYSSTGGAYCPDDRRSIMPPVDNSEARMSAITSVAGGSEYRRSAGSDFFAQSSLSTSNMSCALQGKDRTVPPGADIFCYPSSAYPGERRTGTLSPYPSLPGSSCGDYAGLSRNPFYPLPPFSVDPYNMPIGMLPTSSEHSTPSTGLTMSSCSATPHGGKRSSQAGSRPMNGSGAATERTVNQSGGSSAERDRCKSRGSYTSSGKSNDLYYAAPCAVGSRGSTGGGQFSTGMSSSLESAASRLEGSVSSRTSGTASSFGRQTSDVPLSTSGHRTRSPTPLASDRSSSFGYSGSTPALHHPPQTAAASSRRCPSQHASTAGFEISNFPPPLGGSQFSPNLSALTFDPPPLNFSRDCSGLTGSHPGAGGTNSSKKSSNAISQDGSKATHGGGGGGGGIGSHSTGGSKQTSASHHASSAPASSSMHSSSSCKTSVNRSSSSSLKSSKRTSSSKTGNNQSSTASTSALVPYELDPVMFDARCMTPYFSMTAQSTSPPTSRNIASDSLAYFPSNLFGGSVSGRVPSSSSAAKTLQHRDTPNPFNTSLFSPSSRAAAQSAALFQPAPPGFTLDHHGHMTPSAAHHSSGAGSMHGFGYIFPPDIGGSSSQRMSPIKFGSGSDATSALHHHANTAAVQHAAHQHQNAAASMYHNNRAAAGQLPLGAHLSHGSHLPPGAHMLHDMGFNSALMLGHQHPGFDAYNPFTGTHGHPASFGMGTLNFPMHNIR